MATINFMPAHVQAPTSLALLEDHFDEAVLKAREEDAKLLLPASQEALAARLEEAGVSVVRADGSIGFLYSNVTAVRNLTAGEKPFPTAATLAPSRMLVSGASWLGLPERLVWVEGASAPVKAPLGCSARDLISAAGLDGQDVKAVYLGYPASRFVCAAQLDEPLDTADFDFMRVYGSKSCMANALRVVVGEFCHEGCGRCVLGHEGGYQMSVIMSNICSNKGVASDIALLRDLCPVMGEHALCELGQTLARAVSQALDFFGEEIEAHYARHQCPAGECAAYMTYHVLVSRCTGCGECLSACEEDAIMGKDRFVHVIDQKACVKCGACLPACPEDAIVMAGAKKPKTPPRPIPVKRR